MANECNLFECSFIELSLCFMQFHCNIFIIYEMCLFKWWTSELVNWWTIEWHSDGTEWKRSEWYLMCFQRNFLHKPDHCIWNLGIICFLQYNITILCFFAITNVTQEALILPAIQVHFLRNVKNLWKLQCIDGLWLFGYNSVCRMFGGFRQIFMAPQ